MLRTDKWLLDLYVLYTSYGSVPLTAASFIVQHSIAIVLQ